MKLKQLFTRISACIMLILPIVANATIITIDNGDAGFSSSGLKNSAASCCISQAVGINYMVDDAIADGDYALWDPTSNADWFAGIWKVEINWTHYANRAQNALVTISDGLGTQYINQAANGGTWYDLGTYYFSGINSFVKLDDSNSKNGEYIIADAVRFTHVPAPATLPLFILAGLAMLRFRRK